MAILNEDPCGPIILPA